MITKPKTLPPIKELHRLFELRDGLLYRRTAQGGVQPGTVAGSVIQRGGHICVSISNRRYLAHRIVWALATGEDPAPYQIDHINGDRTDNRIENLRKVTHQQNGMHRTRAQGNSRSGIIGVYPHRATGKWEASICHNGKTIFLGLHERMEDAVSARIAKERELFGEHATKR